MLRRQPHAELAKMLDRRVVTVALNVLYGAAVVTRVNMLKNQGVRLGPEFSRIVPQDSAILEEILN